MSQLHLIDGGLLFLSGGRVCGGCLAELVQAFVVMAREAAEAVRPHSPLPRGAAVVPGSASGGSTGRTMVARRAHGLDVPSQGAVTPGQGTAELASSVPQQGDHAGDGDGDDDGYDDPPEGVLRAGIVVVVVAAEDLAHVVVTTHDCATRPGYGW